MGFQSVARFTSSSFLLLHLAVFNLVSASFSSINICPKYSIQEYFILQEKQCLCDGNGIPSYIDMPSRVAEVNGTTLERALSILQMKDGAYAAVLFYANWCPFSRTSRPLFDTLSSTFPSISHIAVEDSAIQPSALSQYGVHSFPVLFLHNKTVKVRYHGPRTIEAIGDFYKDITGSETVSRMVRQSDGFPFFEKLSMKVLVQSKVHCPYPWAKSPEKWLHDDTYLLLSTLFLVLRVIIYLLPKLARKIKYYCVQKEGSLEAHKFLLRRVLLREQDGVINSFSRSISESELFRKGKGVLSVPGWPSSSLAPVTLAEGSSSRTGGLEDARDNGHAFKGQFWS